MSFVKTRPYIPQTDEKIPRSVYLTIRGLAVTDLLISKSSQFIFVPNCTYAVNTVKFQQAVCKTSVFTMDRWTCILTDAFTS